MRPVERSRQKEDLARRRLLHFPNCSKPLQFSLQQNKRGTDNRERERQRTMQAHQRTAGARVHLPSEPGNLNSNPASTPFPPNLFCSSSRSTHRTPLASYEEESEAVLVEEEEGMRISNPPSPETPFSSPLHAERKARREGSATQQACERGGGGRRTYADPRTSHVQLSNPPWWVVLYVPWVRSVNDPERRWTEPEKIVWPAGWRRRREPGVSVSSIGRRMEWGGEDVLNVEGDKSDG